MSEWSLQTLLSGLHDKVQQSLAVSRQSFGHPGTKGDASEKAWLELLETYLPHRYQAATAHVVDSRDGFSQQMDIVIFDRQYTPLIFEHNDQLVIPAESVYAVFEAKQSINAGQVKYAREKIESVRRLERTSMRIPWLKGVAAAKPLHHIIGGLLTFESDWKPPLGQPLVEALQIQPEKVNNRLDIGCVASHGLFSCDDQGAVTISQQSKPATAFLLELIAKLQEIGTVPMIDIRAYAHWLAD
jgi:hypothetical protein